MTNYEKHKSAIDSIWETNYLIGLNKYTGEIKKCSLGILCKDCEFSDDYNPGTICKITKAKWLMAEYDESKVDWTKVPIDTPILIKNYDDCPWQKGYFAGLNEKGYVTAWANGHTSWVNEGGKPFRWKYAKLAYV